MKKPKLLRFIYVIIIVFAINIVSSIWGTKSLYLENLNYLPLHITDENSVYFDVSYFCFEGNYNLLTVNDIKKVFTRTKSIIVLDEKQCERKIEYARENSPVFVIKVKRYLIFAIIYNLKLAITESIDNQNYYIWFFGRWINIKSRIIGFA
ncbi:hypothetical protein [Lutibacter sp.]